MVGMWRWNSGAVKKGEVLTCLALFLLLDDFDGFAIGLVWHCKGILYTSESQGQARV